jgi:hypothetical protein
VQHKLCYSRVQATESHYGALDRHRDKVALVM